MYLLASVQMSPSPQKKSGRKTSVNPRPVYPVCKGKPLIGCNVNTMTQVISGDVIGE